MGGIGSGRLSTGRSTIESCKRIDIRYFRRHNLLRQGITGMLRWTCRGEPSGDVQYQVCERALLLTYRYRYAGGEWQPVRQEIALATTPCHFGGVRYWLICPDCQRRCAILCGEGRLFLCRRCYQLPYQTQLENEHGRACIRRNKLEDQLYGAGRRRRWKRSTDNLIARLVEAEDEANRALAICLERLGYADVDW